MPYKSKENQRKKSLDYYHRNRDKIILKQIEYKRKKYLTDQEYHLKDNIRKIATHKISLKDKQCIICGSTQDLQRHHKDYSSPLDVQILCRRCHNKEHFRM